MKQKPTFVTIFTDTENFHLVKDVGQVPYFMYKTEGYDAELIGYRNNEEYPYLNKEVKGLKLNFIPNEGRFLYFELGILSYLWSSSESIDVSSIAGSAELLVQRWTWVPVSWKTFSTPGVPVLNLISPNSFFGLPHLAVTSRCGSSLFRRRAQSRSADA